MGSTTNSLRFSTVVITFVAVIVIGMCIISDNGVVEADVKSFTFPYYFCSSDPVDPHSGLGKARANILTDVVKLHWRPDRRSNRLTCIRETREKAAMWARAECHLIDPASAQCNECLVAAKIYLETHCRYFVGGRVNEKSDTCTLLFGDYDVCGQR